MTKIRNESIKEIARNLVKEYKTKEALFGEEGTLKKLFASALEACLEGEMTEHLGYERYSRDGEVENSRNGHSNKEVITDRGFIEIEVPRDRASNFEPQIIRDKTDLIILMIK